MCGIFGYLTSDPGWPAAGALERACATLRHRGPDGSGVFEDTRGDPSCGLAHTRLSIIDLSEAGRQPMSTEEGRYTIVYNGEVYNHAALRRELAAAGDRFESRCDTEVVLRAYARWGDACIQRFRGMFAFAIWDAVDRSLFVARDRLG